MTVPDLSGCFSAGETLDEALQEVTEAIKCHLEGLLMDGESIPVPHSIEYYQSDSDYADGVWAVVTIDLAKLSGKTTRVNITLPERVLNLMDKFAAENGETRSGLIAQAALEYIAAHENA